ncbi:hypothetical protein HELRODRAFT_169077 [Helobdella robusta]|uniref:Uncharacterized protein n=1 Tax=Helobdella robusta TaxID=6412 RepID=T1F1D4_HELRO|nr:hypothetical protein HELRODRAFT_169077 [Helobdella robusta]ESO09135.1 hypothetical protein HELRODRAFT_169077 [Helobdella robusta]
MNSKIVLFVALMVCLTSALIFPRDQAKREVKRHEGEEAEDFFESSMLIKRYFRDVQKRSSMNFENRWVLRSALNFASDGEVVREVASAREQDMEIYEKRKGHEQLDEQQS